ncbi:MAG: NINE protein [Planctomycetales bacterium]|nr:NINE protein [Planctomycetales bacterium]
MKCPQCQTVLSVPAGGAAPSAPVAAKKKELSYHLKTEDGQTFGPVPKSELDGWLEEGRITAECQLLQDGGDQWQWASDVYPQLAAEQQPAGGGGAAAASDNPFAGIDAGGSGGGGASDNPFAFAADTSPTSRVGGGKKSSSSVAVSRKSSPGASAAASGEVSDKSKMVAGLLGLFLGAYGIGRFYLGYTGIGVAMLLTCGGCGWWAFIDGIMIFMGKVPDAQGRPLKD